MPDRQPALSGRTLSLERIPPLVSLGLSAAIWALVYAPALTFSVSDFLRHLQPWLDHIRANGGFAALSGDFSEYAPPYLYLLAALSYFDFPFNDQVLIKLINAPFVLAAAIAIFFICRHFGKGRNTSAAAAACTILLPTLAVNAFVWGQADAIYSSLLLISALLILKKRPYWAVAAFSASLCIKLQSMFLAPFILLMVFAGRIPWRALLLGPVVYAASILPAALLGRPIGELLRIYLVQGQFYNTLSFNAANPYFVLDHVFKASSNWQVYKYVTLAGLALSSAVGALISAIGVGRRAFSDRAVLIAAALSVTVMPFVLPKMHDRYFIVADLFIFALAWIDRRFLWAAIAIQVSSGLSYAPEFSLYALPGAPGDWAWAVLVAAAINAGIIAHLALSLKSELGRLWDLEAFKHLIPALRVAKG